MKTTKEIVLEFENIGHDPANEEYYNQKWFSEEEIKKAIIKVRNNPDIESCEDLDYLYSALFGDKE